MIELDKRKGSIELLELLPKGTPAKITHLEYGDAAFMGNGPDGIPVLIGVERKTTRDFVDSMRDRRLPEHQLPGLLASYNYVYLILEGLQPTITNMGVSDREFNRLLNDIMVITGVKVLRSFRAHHTADIIHDLFVWWNRPWSEHELTGFEVTPEPTGPWGPRGLIQKVARVFPLIGPEKSKAAADHFGSVQDMINAPASEWCKIPGVGERAAQATANAIRERKGAES